MNNGKTKLVGPGFAARKFEVSTETVRQWVASGKLASIKTEDGRNLFTLQEIDRVAADRARQLGG